MTIEEKLEKYRDEFLECKTPEAFLAWGIKWRELITDEEMADEEMVDSILGKEFEEHMLYIIHLVGTNPDMIINQMRIYRKNSKIRIFRKKNNERYERKKYKIRRRV